MLRKCTARSWLTHAMTNRKVNILKNFSGLTVTSKADFQPTSDWTTLIKNKMWYTVLESRDIWRHWSKNACSVGSKRFSNLLQNKVSSLKRENSFFIFSLICLMQVVDCIRRHHCLCFLTKHNRNLLGEVVWLRMLSISWKLLSHHRLTPDCRSSLMHHDSPPLKAADRRATNNNSATVDQQGNHYTLGAGRTATIISLKKPMALFFFLNIELF